jgi:hypothetical protein
MVPATLSAGRWRRCLSRVRSAGRGRGGSACRTAGAEPEGCAGAGGGSRPRGCPPAISSRMNSARAAKTEDQYCRGGGGVRALWASLNDTAAPAADDATIRSGRGGPPVQARHDQGVAGPQVVQAGRQLGPVGVPPYDVQALLGHESYRTTERYAVAPDAHDKVMQSWARRRDASVTHEPIRRFGPCLVRAHMGPHG